MAIAKSSKKTAKRAPAGSSRSASKTTGQLSRTQSGNSGYKEDDENGRSLKSTSKTSSSMQSSKSNLTSQKNSGNRNTSNNGGRNTPSGSSKKTSEGRYGNNPTGKGSSSNRKSGNQNENSRWDDNRGNNPYGQFDDNRRNYQGNEQGRRGNYGGGWNDDQRGSSMSGRYGQTDNSQRNYGRDEWNEGGGRMGNYENYRSGDRMYRDESHQGQRDQQGRYSGGRNNPSSRKSHYMKSRPSGEQEEGLRKLLMDQMKDMYWAEKALTKAIPKMIKQASSDELIDALSNHLHETEGQINKLEEAFQILGEKAVAKKCEAMDGLIKEASELMGDLDKGSLRDAGIICAGQKVEHYEIATYGCLKTYAETLGEMEVANLLEEILGEEKNADDTLTEISQSINWEAATESDDEDSEEDEDEEGVGKVYATKSNKKYSGAKK